MGITRVSSSRFRRLPDSTQIVPCSPSLFCTRSRRNIFRRHIRGAGGSKMQRNVILIGALLLLAGCGSKPAATANQEEAAAAKPNCLFVNGQTAPAGQPADDIIGVRQGMTFTQARNVLRCRNKSYAINASNSNLALPNGGQISEIDLTADTGLDKVEVWLVGPPGTEKVVRVERTVQFDDNKQLSIQSIIQDITKKYGEFDTSGNQPTGVIVRALNKERMTSDNANYSECENSNIQTTSELPCLSAVSYQVQTSPQNPQLASSFDVAVMNYAEVWSMVQAAERQLAAQVDQARSSPAPRL